MFYLEKTMELSLDLSLVWVPKSMSEFVDQVSNIPDGSQRSSMIDDYINRLRDELKKIDAFKRELPLCMLLLDDAIERLKEEATKCKETKDRFGSEEVVPLKRNIEEEEEEEEEEEDGRTKMDDKDSDEKKNWMSSVQLWNTDIDLDGQRQDLVPQLNLTREENPIQLCTSRNRGGAFMPFKGQSENKQENDMSGLSLMIPISSSLYSDPNLSKLHKRQQQCPRKQRRCWSPELHRQFLEALQQLGGSQVATPKQIRELMQVDGLTNDEVKSHLQKYRLHIRKLPNSSAEQANDLWIAPNHCCGHMKANISQSGSPQGPFHGNGPAKVNSSSLSLEAEEDENSDGHSWRDNHAILNPLVIDL